MKEQNFQIWVPLLLNTVTLADVTEHQDTTNSYSTVSCVLCKTDSSQRNVSMQTLVWILIEKLCTRSYEINVFCNGDITRNKYIYVCSFSFRICVGTFLKYSVEGEWEEMNKQKMENIGQKDQSFFLRMTLNKFSGFLSYQCILCKKKVKKR